MEVFRQEKTRSCYARPIPKNVRSVWDFKSVLELEEEVNILANFKMVRNFHKKPMNIV